MLKWKKIPTIFFQIVLPIERNLKSQNFDEKSEVKEQKFFLCKNLFERNLATD
jgi:hypothetical protein